MSIFFTAFNMILEWGKDEALDTIVDATQIETDETATVSVRINPTVKKLLHQLQKSLMIITSPPSKLVVPPSREKSRTCHICPPMRYRCQASTHVPLLNWPTPNCGPLSNRNTLLFSRTSSHPHCPRFTLRCILILYSYHTSMVLGLINSIINEGLKLVNLRHNPNQSTCRCVLRTG